MCSPAAVGSNDSGVPRFLPQSSGNSSIRRQRKVMGRKERNMALSREGEEEGEGRGRFLHA